MMNWNGRNKIIVLRKGLLLAAVIAFVFALSSACSISLNGGNASEETAGALPQTLPLSESTPDKVSGGALLPAEDLPQAQVLRVIDGDTIEVSWGDTKEKVRLIGVDTPESVHPDQSKNVPYGKIASEFTKSTLEGQTVGLEFDVQERDRYGRLLAYVYLGDIMFNKLLLDEGHASISTFPPNVRYVSMFTDAQTAARDAGKGQWADRPSASSEENSPQSQYIGSARSFKFHIADCIWAQKITANNAVYFDTRDEASDAGYVPCKVCNP
jgi:micrococcal nuclease